ncbi:MAG: tRNA lysidine(34) synthetase TilS, partial [Lachnospiraceae bacterium]|nr:tRNA lysidine(34) synthetase TilS [Lachnospiraceae bacterium]
RREYDHVILERNLGEEAQENGASQNLIKEEQKIPLSELSEKGSLTISWGDDVFLFRIFPYEKKDQIPENTYTKWFDYDKIKNTLSIRTRRPGDYLMIRGGDGRPVRKRLKEYFITEKFPRRDRETLPLLVEEGQVLWITGHRISEAYKVEECTKTILQVEWKKKWRTKDGGACQGTDI